MMDHSRRTSFSPLRVSNFDHFADEPNLTALDDFDDTVTDS